MNKLLILYPKNVKNGGKLKKTRKKFNEWYLRLVCGRIMGSIASHLGRLSSLWNNLCHWLAFQILSRLLCTILGWLIWLNLFQRLVRKAAVFVHESRSIHLAVFVVITFIHIRRLLLLLVWIVIARSLLAARILTIGFWLHLIQNMLSFC